MNRERRFNIDYTKSKKYIIFAFEYFFNKNHE